MWIGLNAITADYHYTWVQGNSSFRYWFDVASGDPTPYPPWDVLCAKMGGMGPWWIGGTHAWFLDVCGYNFLYLCETCMIGSSTTQLPSQSCITPTMHPTVSPTRPTRIPTRQPTAPTAQPTFVTCDHGYVYSSELNGCYQLYSTRVPWSNARAICESNGGWLVTINR